MKMTRLWPKTPRSVELDLVRVFERAEFTADQREGVRPLDRNVLVARLVINHWMGETALLLEPIVRLLREP
jgi:hypothetical protein